MIAADIMTDKPITIDPSATVRDAVDMLQSMQVRHLPVVDAAGDLVGMLSDRDLGSLMSSFAEGAEAGRDVASFSDRRVSDLMSSDVVSVDEGAEVSAIIETMLEQRVGALPVVDGEGTVSGIISYVDILRVLGGAIDEAPKARTSPPATKRSGAARAPR
jgi:CBS domain-containing protein